MAGTGDKLMTASEIKEVTDTKLVKDFSSLTALSGTPATGDLVPIKSGNNTYKIDYNALASAILGQISSNGVVNVANGGTGSNSATGALSGLIGALDTSSGFSLSDTIPVSINGTAYTITGSTLSNAVIGGGTGVTATLPIANGGTGAASASAARTALDVYSKSEVTTAISQSTALSRLMTATSVAGANDNPAIFTPGLYSLVGSNYNTSAWPAQNLYGILVVWDTPYYREALILGSNNALYVGHAVKSESTPAFRWIILTP